MASAEDGTDGLTELDRELRERVADEFRLEAEEGERLAALAARRDRDLQTVGAELRDRGDRVAVDVAGRRYLGTVVHVGSDLIQLRTGTPGARTSPSGVVGATSVIDVHIGAQIVLRIVERVAEGGTGPSTGPATFRARLLELEMAGTEVELTAEAVSGVVGGRLTAVARDHVVLVDPDGSEWYVPTATITTVRSHPGETRGN